MRKLIGIAVLLLLTSFLFAEIVPVNQVKPRMKGYLSTVFEGTTETRVEFEVKGTTYELLNSQYMPIIWNLAQVQPGQPVPAAGQSGSPCWLYTDSGEKFLGLLSLGSGYMDKSPLFGITPYEYIVKNSNSSQTNLIAQKLNLNHLPLLLNLNSLDGYSNLDLNQIFPEDKFKLILNPGQNNNEPVEVEMVKIRPGLPINIYLVRGDLNLYVHGTLGVIDGAQFTALGHAIWGFGDTDLPVYPASVITTVENYFQSYRLPGQDIGPLLGTITTDTHWGVKGQVGLQPKMIPVNFAFQNQKFSQQRNFEVVRIKLTPELISSIINYYLLTIGSETKIDSLNRGNISIETTYLFKNRVPYIQTQIYNFENNYSQSVSQYARFLLNNVLTPIFNNPVTMADLDRISFDVKVAADFKKLALEKIKVKGKIGPEKKIDLRLSLFSADQTTRYKTQLQIRCPDGARKGEGQIEVRTGMYFFNPLNSWKTIDDLLRVQTNTTIFIKLVCYFEKDNANQVKGAQLVKVEGEGKQKLNSIWQVEKLSTKEKVEILFELKLPVLAETAINMVFLPDDQGGFDHER